MTKREDLRITKTKNALINAFFVTLEDTALEDITVNALCEKAGVRRATFYKHFTDKSDFILFLIKDVRERFEEEVWNSRANTTPTKEYYIEYAEALMDYLLEKNIAVNKIVNSSVRSTFLEVFAQQNFIDTRNRLESSAKAGMQLISTPDVVASMLVGGITRCITNWFESEEKCPVETLLSEISKIIDRVLS